MLLIPIKSRSFMKMKKMQLYMTQSICAFSPLRYFRVPEIFPFDIIHDCLEGIIALTVKRVLQQLYNKNLLQLKIWMNPSITPGYLSVIS